MAIKYKFNLIHANKRINVYMRCEINVALITDVLEHGVP